MAFIRKVKTFSGGNYISNRFKIDGHIFKVIYGGSAHNKVELDILVTKAHKRLFTDQLELLP